MGVADDGGTGADAGVAAGRTKAMSAVNTLRSTIANIHQKRWLFEPGCEILRVKDI
ncbi:hypothetical protein [Arthrobacter sp. HLT1-21]